MPAGVLSTIIQRNHAEDYLRRLPLGSLAFPYGPDLIRDVAVAWRIVEDSAGHLGGLGDLVHGRRVLQRLLPSLSSWTSRAHDPKQYFSELAIYFQERAQQFRGVPLLCLRPFRDENDGETRRLAAVFASLGIESATLHGRSKKVVIDEQGVFLRARSGKKKVGALILHATPEGLDARPFVISVNLLRDGKSVSYANHLIRRLAREFSAPSLKKAIQQGQVWSNFSPSVRFVNDKAFGRYVDSMIEIFLKEMPIIRSIPSRLFAIWKPFHGWKLDNDVLRQLRKSRERFVVKKVDEDGGQGVWIGRKESRRSMEFLISRIRMAPEKFLLQEFEHLSVVDNRIVDLRIHAHVDEERIVVSNTPWGRANWLRGDGKVNLSAKGFDSPVLVVNGETNFPAGY